MQRRAGLTPRKQPQQERSRATVEFVLEAAAQVFGELGYAGATTNKIAERAGVSVGSLYQYFPSKDALLVALAERHVAEAAALTETVARRLRRDRPGIEEVVRTLVELYVAANGVGDAVEGDARSGDERISLYRVLYDEAPRTAELRAVLARLHASVAGEVEHHLRRLGLGTHDPGLAATVVVHAADALIHEVVLRPPPGRTVEACVDEVVACCLGYLRYGPPPP